MRPKVIRVKPAVRSLELEEIERGEVEVGERLETAADLEDRVRLELDAVVELAHAAVAFAAGFALAELLAYGAYRTIDCTPLSIARFWENKPIHETIVI